MITWPPGVTADFSRLQSLFGLVRALGGSTTLAWAVQAAQSGHPGAPLGLAPAAYVLYTRVMKHAPTHPDWPDRDRFVLSAGHASMLLYSTLYLSGYGLTLDDLKNFRQLGSPSGAYTFNTNWTQRDPVVASSTGGFALASLLLGLGSGSISHDPATAEVQG